MVFRTVDVDRSLKPTGANTGRGAARAPCVAARRLRTAPRAPCSCTPLKGPEPRPATGVAPSAHRGIGAAPAQLRRPAGPEAPGGRRGPVRARRPGTGRPGSAFDGPGPARGEEAGQVAGAPALVGLEQLPASWPRRTRGAPRPGTRRSGSARRGPGPGGDSWKASPGSSRRSSWTSRASSPTSATSTTRRRPSGSMTTPCCCSAPKRMGSPWTRGIRLSGRASLAGDLLEGAVVEDVAVLVDLDEGGARCGRGPGGRSPACACGPCRGCGPRSVASAPRARLIGLKGVSSDPNGRRLGDLALLRGRRVLALGQPVDLVVEEQDGDVDVAAQGVDEVVAADRQGVAVAGDDPHVEVGPGHGQPGGHRRGPAVDGVHAVGVHVIGEAGRAADAGHEDGVLAPHPELGHEHLHGGQDGVVPAARAPADLLVRGPVLAGGDGDRRCRSSAGHVLFVDGGAGGRRRASRGRPPRSRRPGTATPWTLVSVRASTRKSARTILDQLAQVGLGHEDLVVGAQDVAEVGREGVEVDEMGVGHRQPPGPHPAHAGGDGPVGRPPAEHEHGGAPDAVGVVDLEQAGCRWRCRPPWPPAGGPCARGWRGRRRRCPSRPAFSRPPMRCSSPGVPGTAHGRARVSSSRT